MRSSSPDAVLEKAEDLRERSRYREALSAYARALRTCRNRGDRQGMLSCLLSLGDTRRMTGNFIDAADAYVEALSLSRELRTVTQGADAMVGLGLSLRALGDWNIALRWFSRAKRIYEKYDDREGTAFVTWAEAGAFRVGGDIPAALRSFRKAKRLFGSFPGPEGKKAVGYCLCGLGGVSRVAGRWDDSLAYYTEANTVLSALRDRFGIAYSHCGIGNALRMRGAYADALSHLRKAERIYRSIGDVVSYAYTLWSIGMTDVMTGRHEKADAYFARAAERFRKTKDIRGLVYYRLGVAEARLLRHDGRGAKRMIEQALGDARDKRLAIELCHARTLLDYVRRRKSSPECYRRLGMRPCVPFPFNIP